MLQTFTNTRPYCQPLSPLTVDGERYALPDGFVDCLAFLTPFVMRRGNPVEQWVHLIDGKLKVITNSLILECNVAPTTLPNLKFKPKAIRTLEAFGSAPTMLTINLDSYLFEWADGQQFFVSAESSTGPIWMGDRDAEDNPRANVVANNWRFGDGGKLNDDTRSNIKKTLRSTKVHNDVYLSPLGLISRMKSHKNSDEFTSESLTDFTSNATRLMRFDRASFLKMCNVATEIDFSCSPVCFHHPHGRGLLIERSPSPNAPDWEVWND